MNADKIHEENLDAAQREKDYFLSSRVVCVIQKIAVFVLLFVGTLAGQAQTKLYGDVNGDGSVNIADVNAVVAVILGDYHAPSILGSWYSEYFVDEDGRYDVPESIAVSFDFYGDYTGRYSYLEKDEMIHVSLRWNLQGQRLYLWFIDGDYEELYCKIDENGYMLLSLYEDFHNYTGYRPVSPSSAVIDMNGSCAPKRVSRASMEKVKMKN